DLPDNPTAGARLFVDKGCVRCHALGGDETRVGPDLGRIHFRGTITDLAGALWNHSPVMREKMQDLKIQPPRLDSREMSDLVAYLQSANGGATAERVYFEPGSPRRGRELFAAKRCVDCHAIAGVGGTRGPDLGARGREFVGSISNIDGLMWNHSRGMSAEF